MRIVVDAMDIAIIASLVLCLGIIDVRCDGRLGEFLFMMALYVVYVFRYFIGLMCVWLLGRIIGLMAARRFWCCICGWRTRHPECHHPDIMAVAIAAQQAYEHTIMRGTWSRLPTTKKSRASLVVVLDKPTQDEEESNGAVVCDPLTFASAFLTSMGKGSVDAHSPHVAEMCMYHYIVKCAVQYRLLWQPVMPACTFLLKAYAPCKNPCYV